MSVSGFDACGMKLLSVATVAGGWGEKLTLLTDKYSLINKLVADVALIPLSVAYWDTH
jgi:hypothetical protein